MGKALWMVIGLCATMLLPSVADADSRRKVAAGDRGIKIVDTSGFHLSDSSELGEPIEAPTGLSLMDERLHVKRKLWWAAALKDLDMDFAASEINLSMGFSIPERHAHLSVGDVRTGAAFGLRVASDVDFRGGYPKIKTHLDLGVAGKKYGVDLPEVTIIPRTYQGQRYFEYRIPVLQAKF